MERQGLGRRLASTVFAFSGPLDSRLVREGEEGREGVREGRQEGRGDRSVSVAFLSDPPPPFPPSLLLLRAAAAARADTGRKRRRAKAAWLGSEKK